MEKLSSTKLRKRINDLFFVVLVRIALGMFVLSLCASLFIMEAKMKVMKYASKRK